MITVSNRDRRGPGRRGPAASRQADPRIRGVDRASRGTLAGLAQVVGGTSSRRAFAPRGPWRNRTGRDRGAAFVEGRGCPRRRREVPAKGPRAKSRRPHCHFGAPALFMGESGNARGDRTAGRSRPFCRPRWSKVAVRLPGRHCSRRRRDLQLPDGAVGYTESIDVLGLFAFVHRAALTEALDRAIMEEADDASALTDEQRRDRLAEITGDRLEVERRGVLAGLERPRSSGLRIEHRGDCDPMAVLGVKVSPAKPPVPVEPSWRQSFDLIRMGGRSGFRDRAACRETVSDLLAILARSAGRGCASCRAART